MRGKVGERRQYRGPATNGVKSFTWPSERRLFVFSPKHTRKERTCPLNPKGPSALVFLSQVYKGIDHINRFGRYVLNMDADVHSLDDELILTS